MPWKDKAAEGEGWAPPLAVAKIQWDSDSPLPLWLLGSGTPLPFSIDYNAFVLSQFKDLQCFSALLHLYYARFFNHFLCDIGLTKHREPFVNLLTQGMVKGKSYKVKKTGHYLRRKEVDFSGM